MKKNNTTLLLIVLFVTISFMLIGFTFAYFIVQGNKETNAAINATTYTTDSLTFEVGKDIAFSLNQLNLAPGGENQSGETSAKATLIANNKTNEATSSYYVYLNITNNEFIYTTDNNTPELILSITDPSGKNVTSITGLTYGTYNGVSGFDITTKTGLIKIAEKYQINASPKTVQEWKVKVTFVNLDSDQGANSEKVAEAKILIQESRKSAPVSEACIGEVLGECITQNYDAEPSLYYHNDSLENGAGDNSYRYSGGDYNLTDKAVEAGYSRIAVAGKSDITRVIDLYVNGSKTYIGDYIVSPKYYYALAYDTAKKQYSTYSEALNKAVEDGYLTKDNVKNFVCFGTDATTCPIANLYRIIGVFDNQVKLIKYDYATKEMLGEDGESYTSTGTTLIFVGARGENPLGNDLYRWNYNNNTNSVDWSTSLLNLTNLNTNFLNYLGEKWTNLIADTEWKMGPSNIYDSTANEFYKNEIKNAKNTYGPSKIGLMYLNEYGYAATQTAWTTSLRSYGNGPIKFFNWMWMGKDDWAICPENTSGIININGAGYSYPNFSGNAYSIRPTFYLKSDVKLISGKGTITNPYRVQ